MKNKENHPAKMVDFFNKISPEELATILRQVNYFLASSMLRDSVNSIDLTGAEYVENGYYWLNELAEALNPVLTKK